MLKILLFLYFSKTGCFSPKFCTFDKMFLQEKDFRFLTAKNLEWAIAMTPVHKNILLVNISAINRLQRCCYGLLLFTWTSIVHHVDVQKFTSKINSRAVCTRTLR